MLRMLPQPTNVQFWGASNSSELGRSTGWIKELNIRGESNNNRARSFDKVLGSKSG